MLDIILGNVCSLGAMVCDSVSGTRKTKKGILLFQMGSQFFYLASALALSQYSAATQNVVAIFRNMYGAKEKESKVMDWLFVISPLVLGVVFNNSGLLGLVPVLANLQYGLVVLVLKGKPKAIKISFIVCCSAFSFFNLAVKNYVGTVSCLIVVISTLISILKHENQE